jgi:ribose 5-phosphate isomerase B
MSKKLKFIVASDHTDRGNLILKEIVEFLGAQGHRGVIYDKVCGPSDDFPLIAQGAVEQVRSGDFDRAILIGGHGSGMAIVANKFKGIRAAVVRNHREMRASAERDDPNVICLPAWSSAREEMILVLRTWLAAELSVDEKYGRRREEILEIEEKNFR